MKINKLINESRKKILRRRIYQDVRNINPKAILDNGSGLNGSFDYREFKNKVIQADVLKGIDCQDLPYETSSFDCVIFAGVIQYVNNPVKAISECKRVLKKNGTLIISTINKDSLIKRILGLGDEKKGYSMREFSELLERNNFKVKEEKYIDFKLFPKKYKLILYCVCTKNSIDKDQ